MNLTLIPLLIAALMLATTDSDVDSVEVVLSGQHHIEDHRGALIIGDADITIQADVEIPGPVYVIGGETVIAGGVTTDVVQLAGTVTVQSGATIGDELRLIGGTQSVSADAEVGRRTSLQVNSAQGSPVTRIVFTGLLTLLLAWIAARLSVRRRRILDNVAGAVVGHPLVSITVGLLLVLTTLAVLVFMAFTLILIPVALVGMLAGSATLAYGIIAWGYLIGNRLPVERPGLATALGVLAVITTLQVASVIPLIGNVVVLGLVLTVVGAIAITYYGVTPFQPAELPD